MANDGTDGKSDVPVGVVFIGDTYEWQILEQLLIRLGFKGGDILKQHVADKYTAEIMLYYEYEDYSAPVKWLLWSYTLKQDHLRVKSMGWRGTLEYTYVGTIEKEPAEYIPHLLRWSEGKLVESYEVPQMHVAQLVIKKGDSPLTTITRTYDWEYFFKITETWKLEYLCEVDYGNASDGYTYAEGVFNDGWAYVIEITLVSQEVEEIPVVFLPWSYWF